jgi:membrane associated rhomboid family serine protease
MSGIIDDLKRTYANGGALIRLIYLNSAIFFVFQLVYLGFVLSGNALLFPCDAWFSMPSSPDKLILKPWTLVTYMFYHHEILHFIFNMLNLYWFGKIFLMYFDEKKLVPVYLLGGIAGGLLYLAVYNALPAVFPSSILMGASASVLALMAVSAIYAPNMKLMMFFVGEVKLIYIFWFSVLMFVIMISSNNAGGNIAHLGGILFGYLWVKQHQKGTDIAGWLGKLSQWIMNNVFTRRKLKVTYKSPPRNEMEYNRVKNINQQEIDRILDKISKAGYDSLSKQEKETLFSAGNKN